MADITKIKNEETKNNDVNKISVQDYLNDNSLLEVSYLPFDTKLSIVSHILNEVISSVGGLNTSLLRRIATEAIIETVTNINMSITDDNGLSGYDQLCYFNELDNLKTIIGNEYTAFEEILAERVSDFVRMETNSALTINKIYEQIMNMINLFLDKISDYIQNVDVDEVVNTFASLANNAGGDEIES